MLNAIFSWNTLWVILVCLYIPACVGLIVIVLLQKGKGTSFAGAFGIGAGSDTVFGPRASKSLPVKLTYVMAAMFVVIALAMSLIAGKLNRGEAPELVDPNAGKADMSVYEERGIADAPEAETAEGVATDTAPAEGAAEEPSAATEDQQDTEATPQDGGETKPVDGN